MTGLGCALVMVELKISDRVKKTVRFLKANMAVERCNYLLC